ALQAMLSRIREEIHEEFRTGSGSSNAGGNPTLVTIHPWLERFNKQKPHSFEKATVPVDAENWISHMEKIFDVMGCEDAFKTRLAVYKFEGNALAWWKAYKQAKGGDACQDKYVAEILRKFSLTNGKSASTPIDIKKPLLKDPDGKDMDTVVATSSTEAEYVAAASCCAQYQVDEKDRIEVTFVDLKVTAVRLIITAEEGDHKEDTIRQNLRLDDADGIDCLPNEEIFTELARMGYEKLSTKLTFYKTCATLTQKVANLEEEKIAQALEITKLKQRVKKLEKKRKFKSSGLKRLKKVGTAHRVESSIDLLWMISVKPT
nr:zinc finger, CCHC-type, retrotransposon Gag domain protein [Tanacetum cinerariifolium]